MVKKILFVAVLAFAVAACAPAAPSEPTVGLPEPLPVERGAPTAPEEQLSFGDATTLVQAEDRMIIRTATIEMVVVDTEEVLAKIEALAAQLGGYVSNSQSWKVEDGLLAQITIRVPNDRYEEARERIKEEAAEPPTESQNTQDVTQEFVDLEARLENLRLTEQELRELLATVEERLEKAEDILAVFRELSNVRQQIEQIQGQMQYLENLTALASITVSLTPQPKVAETGWDPGRTVREAARDLVVALQALADIAIRLLITVLPLFLLFLIPLLVVLWLALRWWQGRRKAAPPLPTA